MAKPTSAEIQKSNERFLESLRQSGEHMLIVCRRKAQQRREQEERRQSEVRRSREVFQSDLKKSMEHLMAPVDPSVG